MSPGRDGIPTAERSAEKIVAMSQLWPWEGSWGLIFSLIGGTHEDQ